MTVLLARPYPVDRLADARLALLATAEGDLLPLHRLYQDAAAALAALDPDEVQEFLDEHPKVQKDDQALARAAIAVADTWEGVVSIGATLTGRRFRSFAWLAAQIRYNLEPARRDAARLRFFAEGGDLPLTSRADAALYVALPALIGLGPELPDEIEGPCPIDGQSVVRLLGLEPPADAPRDDEEWVGIDPLDGIAITAEACRAHFAAAPPEWRSLLSRGAATGIIARQADESSP